MSKETYKVSKETYTVSKETYKVSKETYKAVYLDRISKSTRGVPVWTFLNPINNLILKLQTPFP